MTRSTGVGRGRKGIPRGNRSVVRGQKRCWGPLHQDGVWLPATSEYFYPDNSRKRVTPGFVAVCKSCRRHKQNKSNRMNVGYIPISRIKFAIIELENRLGRTEAGRRLGWSSSKTSRVLKGRQQYLEAETVRRIIEVLRDVRSRNEVRHRRAIKHGYQARGMPEPKPTRRKDFYKIGGGDDEAQDRKRRREADPEREKAYQAQYRERRNELERLRRKKKQ